MNSLVLDLPYHQQDDERYCGLAVAQMMLASAGAGPQPIPQPDLGAGLDLTSSGIDPVTLATILNAKWQPSTVSFTGNFDTDRETAIQRIVGALATTGIAVPALVFGGNPHFVAVRGAVVDGDPASGRAELKGFFVANPAPVTASVLMKRLLKPGQIAVAVPSFPLPHIVHDTCGMGEKHGASFEYVTAFAWRNFNWPDAGAPAGHFCTVTAAPAAHAPGTASCVFAAGQPAPANGPVDEAAAKRAALAGIQTHGLDRCGPLRNTLANVQPGNVELHENDPKPGDSWFLVEIVPAAGGPPIAEAFVDEPTGEFLGLIAPPASSNTPHDVDRFAFDTVHELQTSFSSIGSGPLSTVIGSSPFAEIIGGSPLATGDVVVSRRRFWRPCAQSLSPYYAFIETTIRGKTIIIGYDGRVHAELNSVDCCGVVAKRKLRAES